MGANNTWRYENAGTADSLIVSGTTLTDLPETKSKTGTAFYQTAQTKCFDVPATAEVWIKFDVYFDGSNRWRAYNGGANGVTGITAQVGGWGSCFSNGTNVGEKSGVCWAKQLQTVLLHMVSGSSAGVIEVWVDAKKVFSYSCNVNNGQDFADIYLQSGGSGTFFSNVIISNVEIGLDEDVGSQTGGNVELLFDVQRKLRNNVEVSFDTQRLLTRGVNLLADSQRQVFRTAELLNDVERVIANTITVDVQLSFDVQRKLKNNVQASFDSQRQLFYGSEVIADTQRQVFRSVNLIADIDRQLVDENVIDSLKVWLPFTASPIIDKFFNVWTAYGSPTVQNGELQLDGASYLLLNNFLLGGKDFTIDGWLNMGSSSPGNARVLIVQSIDTGLMLVSLRKNTNDGTKLDFWASNYADVSQDYGNIQVSTIESVGKRIHFELDYQYDVGAMTLYIDGVQAAQSTTRPQYNRTNCLVYIGAKPDATQAMTGTLDEFRIFDGVALHKGNFTPPTAADYQYFNAFLPKKQLELDFDVERITTAGQIMEFSFDVERSLCRTENFYADVSLNVTRSVSFASDVAIYSIIPVNMTLDLARNIEAQIILFPIDNSQYFPSQTSTLRAPMLRALDDNVSIVIPSQARPSQANNTQGIQSFEVLLEEHQLSAQVKFTSVLPLKLLQAVSGQFLDFTFKMFVENTRQEGILISADCSASIDELLYSQLNYSVEDEASEYLFDFRTNQFSTKSGSDDSSSDSDDETADDEDEYTEIVKKATASTHLKEIVKQLLGGGDSALELHFTDFVSNLDVEQKNVSFSDLISSLFGWSSRIPNKQINIFTRIVDGKEKLCALERGQELCDIDISDTKHTVPIIEKSIVRTFVGSSPDSSYTMNIQLPGKFLCPPPPDVSPDGKTHYNYKNVSGYSGVEHGYALESSITENDDGSKYEVSYNYAEVNGIYTCVSEVSRSYDENDELIDKKTTIHHRLSPSQQFSRMDDEDGNTVGSNVASNLPGFYNEKITLVEPSANTKTITISGNPLVDMSFPFIDIEDFERVTKDLIDLNRSIQETVSFTIYDYPHLINFTDRISFNDNEYFLISNSALSSHNIFCQQSIVMRRWVPHDS